MDHSSYQHIIDSQVIVFLDYDRIEIPKAMNDGVGDFNSSLVSDLTQKLQDIVPKPSGIF